MVLVDEVEQNADKELDDVNEDNENALAVLHTPELSLLRHVFTEKSQDWLIIDADHHETLQNCRAEGSNRNEDAQSLFQGYERFCSAVYEWHDSHNHQNEVHAACEGHDLNCKA